MSGAPRHALSDNTSMFSHRFRRDFGLSDDPSRELVALRERDAVMRALFVSAANLLDVRDTNADTVIAQICRAIVDSTPHLRLAWFWAGPRTVDTIRPQIYAGPASEYARTLEIPRTWLTRRGPAFRALDDAEPDVTRVLPLAPYGPWRRGRAEYGFEVAVGIPVRMPDAGTRGLLVFYADDARYFSRVGAAPFVAFANLAEVALQQASRQQALLALAERDPLTGLLNRRGAQSQLSAAWDGIARQPFSLLMVDIDHFKRVNDTLGHAGGDRVLRDVAQAISMVLRTEDRLARWGGDEFVVLLPDTTPEVARTVAERVHYAVLERGWQSGVQSLSCSIGVASEPTRFADWDAMISHVDRAMYTAKRTGRDRVVVA